MGRDADSVYSEVVEVEFDPADLQMIRLMHNRGFLNDRDLNSIVQPDPKEGSSFFQLTLEAIMYLGFGLQTTLDQLSDESVRESLEATLRKVSPYFDRLPKDDSEGEF